MAINSSLQFFLNRSGNNNGYITKLIGSGGSYNQFGFLDNNNKLYQNFGSDGFPTAPFGVGSPNVISPFTQLVFANSSGNMETGNIIDAKVLPDKSYALFDTGNLYFWGKGGNYNLVVGDTNDRKNPTLSATNVVKVFTPLMYTYDVNYSSTFILKNDGLLYFGGAGNWGQGGLGNTTSYSTWQQVTYFPANSIKNVFLVNNYGTFVFVQKTDGTIHACGYNSSGVLGTGNTTQRTSFIDVTTAWGGISAGDIISITGAWGYYDTGSNDTPVALMHRRSSSNVDTIWHCGNNTWGARANGVLGNNYSTPAQVTTAGFPTSIKKLIGHGGSPLSLSVLANNGDLWKWGHNSEGQGGVNSTTNISTPTFIKSNVADVFGDNAGGHTYTYRNPSFIKLNNGTIQSCAYNDNGQLGVGDTTQRNVFTNVLFSPNVNIVDIKHGNRSAGIYIYALSDTGQLYGIGWGGLGTLDPYRTNDNYIIPRLIPINFNR